MRNFKQISVISFSVLLAACGSGGNPSTESTVSSVTPTTDTPNVDSQGRSFYQADQLDDAKMLSAVAPKESFYADNFDAWANYTYDTLMAITAGQTGPQQYDCNGGGSVNLIEADFPTGLGELTENQDLIAVRLQADFDNCVWQTEDYVFAPALHGGFTQNGLGSASSNEKDTQFANFKVSMAGDKTFTLNSLSAKHVVISNDLNASTTSLVANNHYQLLGPKGEVLIYQNQSSETVAPQVKGDSTSCVKTSSSSGTIESSDFGSVSVNENGEAVGEWLVDQSGVIECRIAETELDLSVQTAVAEMTWMPAPNESHELGEDGTSLVDELTVAYSNNSRNNISYQHADGSRIRYVFSGDSIEVSIDENNDGNDDSSKVLDPVSYLQFIAGLNAEILAD